MTTNDIERIEASDWKWLDHYIARNYPVIITGDTGIRDAMQRWSFDYLVSKHPAHQITVECYPDDPKDRYRPWTWELIPLELGEYISLIRNDLGARRRLYLTDQTVEEMLPNVASEISPPRYIVGKRYEPHILIGIDTFTGCHYHPAPFETLLTNLVGKKKMTLFSARDYRKIYPHAPFRLRGNFSKAPFNDWPAGERRKVLEQPYYISEDDGKKYPKLAQAKAYECVVETGEYLLIPQGWYHVTYGIGETITVNYFFESSWRYSYFPLAVRSVMRNVSKALAIDDYF